MKAKVFYQSLSFMLLIILISFFLISCNKDNKDVASKDRNDKVDTSKKTTTKSETSNSSGKEIFYMKSKENNISCADCHSDGTNSKNLLTKYFSNIQGANKRSSTYNGKFKGDEVVKNAGGATVCWESYLRMKIPMTPDQIKALNDYYASVSTSDSSTEMKYETIALPVRDKSKLKDVQKIITDLKGDSSKGEQLFGNSCAFCHGKSSNIKKVPSILEGFDGNAKSIIYNVRLGNGGMPFFKTHTLSDQEVADISAYVMKANGK